MDSEAQVNRFVIVKVSEPKHSMFNNSIYEECICKKFGDKNNDYVLYSKDIGYNKEGDIIEAECDSYSSKYNYRINCNSYINITKEQEKSNVIKQELNNLLSSLTIESC